MKKLLVFVIVLCLSLSTIPAIAEGIDVTLNYVNVIADGQIVNAPNILWQGSTYIPLRAATEQLGCYVDWDEKTNTASITNDAALVATDLAKLQTQLLSIKDELWAAAQIESEFDEYYDAVTYGYNGVYAAGQDIMNTYAINQHRNYFSSIGTGQTSQMYTAFIDIDSINRVLTYIDYDPNRYHFILYQSLMYCESIQESFNALDMAYKTGASMYLSQAQEYMNAANNYWNSASEELSNIKWHVYNYLCS